jgi:hypothetical protein
MNIRHTDLQINKRHQATNQNSLEMLTSGISISGKEPINVNNRRGEQTEECSESNNDKVSHGQTQGWDATKVRILTGILVELGRAGIHGTGEGWLGHGEFSWLCKVRVVCRSVVGQGSQMNVRLMPSKIYDKLDVGFDSPNDVDEHAVKSQTFLFFDLMPSNILALP